MLLCIKQFMFSYGIISVAKRKFCYHKKNMMYLEEHTVDITECHWQCRDSLSGQKPFKMLIVAMNFVQSKLLSSFVYNKAICSVLQVNICLVLKIVNTYGCLPCIQVRIYFLQAVLEERWKTFVLHAEQKPLGRNRLCSTAWRHGWDVVPVQGEHLFVISAHRAGSLLFLQAEHIDGQGTDQDFR